MPISTAYLFFYLGRNLLVHPRLNCEVICSRQKTKRLNNSFRKQEYIFSPTNKTDMLCILSYHYIYFAHFTYSITLHSLYLVTSTWSREHAVWTNGGPRSQSPSVQYIQMCVFPHPRINHYFIIGVEGRVSLIGCE